MAVKAAVAAAFAAFAVAAFVVACLCNTATFALLIKKTHGFFYMEIFFNIDEQSKTYVQSLLLQQFAAAPYEIFFFYDRESSAVLP